MNDEHEYIDEIRRLLEAKPPDIGGAVSASRIAAEKFPWSLGTYIMYARSLESLTFLGDNYCDRLIHKESLDVHERILLLDADNMYGLEGAGSAAWHLQLYELSLKYLQRFFVLRQSDTEELLVIHAANTYAWLMCDLYRRDEVLEFVKQLNSDMGGLEDIDLLIASIEDGTITEPPLY